MRVSRRIMALAVGIGLVAGCTSSGDDTSSGTTVAMTSVSQAPAPATGVLHGDDPRAEQIVDIVQKAMPELNLQSVMFGVWIGDEEIVRGAIDAPSVQPLTPIDARVRVGQPMEAMLGTVMLQLGAEGKLD